MNNKILGAHILLMLVFVFVGVGCSKTRDETKSTLDLGSVKGSILKDDLGEAEKELDRIAIENPDSAALGKVYFDIAKAYEGKDDLVNARDLYQLILTKYQNVENILEAQESLGRLNVKILFSSIITDEDMLYKVEPGDTLLKIAKKFGTTVDLIKASNSLKGDMIQARSKLKVSTAKYKILVDKSQNVLTLFSDDDNIIKVYPVSTGKSGSTPIGTFTIVNKMKDPVWYKENAIVPAESPDNILGSRWLGISKKGYGIHGTIDPKSVGTQATQGCIRMYNSDVEELFTIIPVGIEVTIME
ncbi:MAG: L,D-transpeptidase family protein [Candidatus Omnitrophica bacterium]|nr:L,D-transpeptidase family protein [Candidatus Omnitrophota bacterium]MBU4589305.1 L,D-transpeptidase family protein [Candidatus Omnitrophota bacterium]